MDSSPMGFQWKLCTQEISIGFGERMKINKQFAPVTIVLEHESDLTDFKNILLTANRYENSNRRIFFSSNLSDLQQKIQYMLDRLNL
jgi:hypothetical protein